MRSRWILIAAFAGMFALGGLTGGFLGRAHTLRELRARMGGPGAEPRTQFRVAALTRALDLTDDQVEAVRTILAEAEAKHELIVGPVRTDLDALRDETDGRIREVLTPEQREKFDEHRRRRGSGGPRPRHGPPR